MSFSLLIRPASAVSGGADNSITFGGEGVLTEIQAVLEGCRSQKRCACFDSYSHIIEVFRIQIKWLPWSDPKAKHSHR